LLDRNPHGVEPTAFGRALLDGGAAMFDELRQAVKNIEYLADPEAGEIRIGSGHHHAPSFVSAVVERMSRRYPRVRFHFFSADTTTFLESELHARKLDLLVARKWGSISDELLSFEHLFDDQNFVVAGAQHPLARKRRIALDELMDQLWALPPRDSQAGATILHAFQAVGLDYPRAAVIATLPEVRMRFVATGRFLATFPSSVLTASTRHPDYKILPVPLPLPHIPTGIVTLKSRTLTPVARLFIEHAHEVAKPLAKGKL
jgi:DNA-binding transcriptional LysR family regulator